jgi:beta-glucosidase
VYIGSEFKAKGAHIALR